MADSPITFILSAIDRGASRTANKVGGALHKMDGAASRAARGVKRLGAALLKIGAVGVAAIGAALVGAVKSASDFEAAMNNVNSIVKASPAALEEMKQAVIGISRTLPQSADTLAKGLYDVASSGFKGKEGIQVLEAAARAASAGLATTEESAAGLTAVLNAYGLKAKYAAKISDIMFKTVDRGVITFPELAENIGKTTAVSAALGVRFGEVAAGLALMTRKGVGAEEATTQLNAIMISILKPSKEATKLAKEIGLNWSAGALKAKGLAGVMADLTKKTGGNKKEMATLLGDTRAIRGAFILAAGGGKEFSAELAIMEKAGGATEAALGEQRKGLAFQMGILGNNINAVAIKIGSVLIPMITPLVVGLSKWLTENDKLISRIGTLVGETLTKAGEFIGGTLIPTVRSIIDTFSDVGKSVGKVVGPIVRDLLPGFKAVGVALFGSGGGGAGKGGKGGKKRGAGGSSGLIGAISELIGVLWGDGEGALAQVVKIVGAAFRDYLLPLLRNTIVELKTIVRWVQKAIEWLGKLSLTNPAATGPGGREGVYGTGRAAGGPVRSGSTYMVGEQGPELFRPSTSGSIVPNHQLGGGGGITINYSPMYSSASPDEARQMVRSIIPELRRELARQGF